MNRSAATLSALPDPSLDWAYFFDIDGTLVDLAATPAGARVEAAFHQLLTSLYHRTGGAVALISGRTIADIDQMFPEVRLPVAGQHGVERRDAAGGISRHSLSPMRLDGVRQALTEAVARHPALLLEDKGLSLALHYRRAPRLGGYAHRLLRLAHERVGGEYTLLAGKCVVELKPAGRDKGDAVREFMQEEPFRGRVPVFVGDDVTDEYGFATVNQLQGHSIKVGPGPTVARGRLPGVRAVRDWLERGGFVA